MQVPGKPHLVLSFGVWCVVWDSRPSQEGWIEEAIKWARKKNDLKLTIKTSRPFSSLDIRYNPNRHGSII